MIFRQHLPLSFVLSWRLLRNGPSVSLFSLLVFFSLGLGVAVLIVVSSVMNGMAEEIENNLLANLPHAEIIAKPDKRPDWQSIYARLRQDSVSPVWGSVYHESYALLGVDQEHIAVKVRAVDKSYAGSKYVDYWSSLREDSWHIVLDAQLTAQIGARIGARLPLSLDRSVASPLGTLMRQRYFSLGAVAPGLSTAIVPTVWINSVDGERFLGAGTKRVRGLALWFTQAEHAEVWYRQAKQILEECCVVKTARDSHEELFAALRLEKRVVALLLYCAILVAVLNLISMFGLFVKHKTHSVVMLMTLGLSRIWVYRSLIFMGMILGLGGILFGALLGLLISLSLETMVNLWQDLTGAYVFSVGGIYIEQLPTQILWSDIGLITGLSALLCIPAIVLPLRSVLAIYPAEVLRHV